MEFVLSNSQGTSVQGTDADLDGLVVDLPDLFSTPRVGADGHVLHARTGNRGGGVVLTLRGHSPALHTLLQQPMGIAWHGHVIDSEGRRFGVERAMALNKPVWFGHDGIYEVRWLVGKFTKADATE